MKSTSLKDIFVRCAEGTTAHAPPKIVDRKYLVAKLFWLLMFLSGVGVFSWFLYELTTSFIKFDTTTDIQLKFSVLDFPAVTICNQNQFRFSRLTPELRSLVDDFLSSKRAEMFGGQDKFIEFQLKQNSGAAGGSDISYSTSNVTSSENSTLANNTMTSAGVDQHSHNNVTQSGNGTSQGSARRRRRRRKRSVTSLSSQGLEVMQSMTDSNFYLLPDINEDWTNMTWFDNVGKTSTGKNILLNLTQYIANNFSSNELIAMGHDIQEMLQECEFMGRICGPRDFYQFYDYKYGNCYTFNSGLDGNIEQVTNPGASFGLSMSMFINQNEYVPVLSAEAGLRVLLHRQGQVPQMEEEGFDISPGTKSEISVRYVEVQRYDGLWGENCTSQTTNRNTTLYPGNYTQKSCLKTCLQYKLVEKMGCAHPVYRKPPTVEVCSPLMYDSLYDYETELLDSEVCNEECPVPCWEAQFQYVISSSQWPADSYQDYLKESLEQRGSEISGLFAGVTSRSEAREVMRKQFLKVNLYYDNLNYYKYTENPKIGIQDFVGAVGGHLGLWIGMSLLSFFEIFELFVSICNYMCCNRKNKTKSLTNLDGTERDVTQTPVKTFALTDYK